MKILVLQNNQDFSLDSKLQFIKDWFKPVVSMEFTVKKTDYKNIPIEKYVDTDGKQYDGINNTWFNTNIAEPAKEAGYECVVFSQSFNDFVSFPAMGYSTKRLNGTYSVMVGSDENDKYNFQGLKYGVFKDRWTEVVRHELCHVLYTIKGIEDRTHYYYSTSHIDKILIELGQIKETPVNLSNTMKYKYFTDKEIVGLKPEFVSILDKARDIAQTPFKITSGYRTPEKNAQVGGVPNSSHTKGLACDLACTDNFKRTLILKGLYNCGADLFIEICKSHIHIDIDSSIHKLGQTMWALDD